MIVESYGKHKRVLTAIVLMAAAVSLLLLAAGGRPPWHAVAAQKAGERFVRECLTEPLGSSTVALQPEIQKEIAAFFTERGFVESISRSGLSRTQEQEGASGEHENVLVFCVARGQRVTLKVMLQYSEDSGTWEPIELTWRDQWLSRW